MPTGKFKGKLKSTVKTLARFPEREMFAKRLGVRRYTGALWGGISQSRKRRLKPPESNARGGDLMSSRQSGGIPPHSKALARRLEHKSFAKRLGVRPAHGALFREAAFHKAAKDD
jgi:hypothetical protein